MGSYIGENCSASRSSSARAEACSSRIEHRTAPFCKMSTANKGRSKGRSNGRAENAARGATKAAAKAATRGAAKAATRGAARVAGQTRESLHPS